MAVTLGLVLSACGQGGPATATDPGTAAMLEQAKSAVAASAGYAPASIEVMAGPAHLRISISDAELAQAAQADRERAAAAAVAAVEQAIAADVRFASIQAISVAIIHPSGAEGADSHTEDVVDFHRGSNQRFSKHST